MYTQLRKILSLFICGSLNLIRRVRVRFLEKKVQKELGHDASLEKIFTHVYHNNMWGTSPHVKNPYYSGSGSHTMGFTQIYTDALAKFCKSKNLTTAVDLGCGDFMVGKHIHHIFKHFIACDIVNELVDYNNENYSDASVEFRQLDITRDPLPDGDVVLCRQVLQHLSNEDILKFVNNLKQKNYSYFILTEHIPSKVFIPNKDKPTGYSIRIGRTDSESGIVITEAPFCLPTLSEKTICEMESGAGIIRTTAYTLK